MGSRCRSCDSPVRRLEAGGVGGAAVMVPLPPEFEDEIAEDFDWDAYPRWLCRFVDALACLECESCDLTLADAATFLASEGGGLAASSLPCRACGSPTLGPLGLECYGVASAPLAYIAPKYGAPLKARICGACHLIRLDLYPDDDEARRELARQVPTAGPCPWCAGGQLRASSLDVPYDGPGVFTEPADSDELTARPTLVADWLLEVCDRCGETRSRARRTVSQ